MTRSSGHRPSTNLLQFLQDRSCYLAALEIGHAPLAPFRHADPYVLSSVLQKAIRRGDHTTARRAGHQLQRMDRSRLWRRLAVVALEDIGIANIDVAAELVAISTFSTARKTLGGDIRALDIAIIRACAAAKDRSGDHLASIVGREPLDPSERAVLRLASPNALLAMVAAPDLPLAMRAHAAAIASGRTSVIVHPVAPNIEAVFDVLHGLGASPLLLTACEVYASRQRDALPVLVPFAAILRATGCTAESEIKVHNLPGAEIISELPAYSFDPVNTRLGRRAVDLFLRAHLMTPPYPARMVAAAIWNMESALCDRTLAWPLGEELRERAYRADLVCRGLPSEQHAELNAWIDHEWPALVAARRAVWNSAVRQFGQGAKAPEQANLPLFVTEKPRRA